MGLDMYLYKKTYVGAKYEWNEVGGTLEIIKGGTQLPITFNRVTYITEEVGYWRKANAIHRWFVDECQDGIDQCQEAYVDTEKLQELLDICIQIKNDHALAAELLPTTSGFFFGSTECDEYYYEDIDYTVDMLKRVLAEDNANASFAYQSSW